MKIMCVELLQNLSVEAKVEATIQLEIDRLAAENLVKMHLLLFSVGCWLS